MLVPQFKLPIQGEKDRCGTVHNNSSLGLAVIHLPNCSPATLSFLCTSSLPHTDDRLVLALAARLPDFRGQFGSFLCSSVALSPGLSVPLALSLAHPCSNANPTI